jgi:hypothetical protein
MGFQILIMGFQILNKDKQPIDVAVLDLEAANFWNVRVDAVKYAAPGKRNTWLDTIGYYISNPIDPYNSKGWDNVKHNLLLSHLSDLYKCVGNERIIREVLTAFTYLGPYFALIDHWNSKGYIPKQIQL